MWLAIVLLLAGCFAPQENERLLTSPFEGRITGLSGNSTAGEIVSSRLAAGDRITTVLVTANLGSQPGVSEPGMAIIAFEFEVDCTEALIRATKQQFYGRDGTLRGSFDLDNQFAANPGMSQLISGLCDAPAGRVESVEFRTFEEYWALVQKQVRRLPH